MQPGPSLAYRNWQGPSMAGAASSELSLRRNALRGAPLRSIHWMPSSLARLDSASARFKVNVLLQCASWFRIRRPSSSIVSALLRHPEVCLSRSRFARSRQIAAF